MPCHFIEVVCETGERKTVPLWKLPQMCAAEVAEKKDAIAACEAEKKAREEAEKRAEEAKLAAAKAEAAALDKPFDLATAAEVK